MVAKFTFNNGLFSGWRFIYIGDNSMAFNAAFVSPSDNFEEIREMVEYAFSTFETK